MPFSVDMVFCPFLIFQLKAENPTFRVVVVVVVDDDDDDTEREKDRERKKTREREERVRNGKFDPMERSSFTEA